MKQTLVSLALFGVGFFAQSASALTNAGLDLSGGLSQSESGSGYFVGVDWQMSNYAEISVSGRSHLNAKQYALSDVLTPERLAQLDELAGGAGKYSPTSFFPRHNTVGMSMTLRYPIDLSGWSVAPFLDVGTQQIRTKDIEIFSTSSSTGGTDTSGGTASSNNKSLATVSFDSFNALAFGAGLQFVVDEHHFRVGYRSYSPSDSWSELQIMQDVAGAWLRYDYFFNDNWAFKFALDSADQFDDPAFDVGIRYRF